MEKDKNFRDYVKSVLEVLNKKYPKQIIKVRDKHLLENLIGQYENCYCDVYELGYKIASRHPLFNGNKRLGIAISAYDRIKYDNVTEPSFKVSEIWDWFDKFDKE